MRPGRRWGEKQKFEEGSSKETKMNHNEKDGEFFDEWQDLRTLLA
jgi:hypothetical protein